MFVTTENELGSALKGHPEIITIEGKELIEKVVKIKSVNKFAWSACIGGLTIAALSSVFAIGGSSCIFILGYKTTVTAIKIAVAGGGVGVLTNLRGYEISQRSSNRMVLKRK